MLLIDVDAFPLVIVRVDGALEETDFSALLAHFEELNKRRDHVSIVLLQRASAPSFPMIRRIAEVSRAGAHRPCRACAIVLSSPLIAGALRAVRWLHPPRWPEHFFDDVDLATAWLERSAQRFEVPITAAMLEAARAAGARPS